MDSTDRTADTPPSGAASTRREFVGAVGAATVLAGAMRAVAADPPRPGAPAGGAPAAPKPTMPLRDFGKTGARVSVFGLGCFPLGALPDDAKGVELVRRALESGCTYLDTAPSYSNGASERRVGAAIKGRPRAAFFLATKTHTRTEREARRDLEASLGRLGVERLDLIQVHAVGDQADLERALAKEGPLAALTKAREEKLVRFIGVTGHMDPKVVRAAVERYDFDSVLFPLNCVDPHHLSFVKDTLPAAVEKGLARVAMKVLASGKLPKLGIEPADCLRYAYGLDVSTVIVGCSSTEEVDLAAKVAVEARRLTAEDEAALLQKTLRHAGRSTEWYKRA